MASAQWTDAIKEDKTIYTKDGILYRYGKPIGAVRPDGYLICQYKTKQILVHRVIFFLEFGYLPINVDHINHNRSDNHPSNLREATPSQNSCHRKYNTLPLGVYQRTRKGRPGIWFECKIQKDYKTYSTFKRKLEDAISWRLEKEHQLFGEFQYGRVE